MDLTNTEWNDYVRALQGLRNSGVFERFMRYHSTFQLEAHGGCYFLPWHRQYLYELERELNRIVPGVSIPYWDWTKVSGGRAINTAFTTDPIWSRVGGANGAGPIPNAPFRGWSVGNTVCQRDFFQNNGNVGGGGGGYTFASSADLARLTQSSDTFSNFGTFVEGLHGAPHVAVGGNMGSIAFSPLDPMFWSHHGFIDKIWRDWQDAGNGNAFGGTHPNRACSLDGVVMEPFGRTVRQMFNQISDCSSYQPSSSGGPTTRALTMGAIRQPSVSGPSLTLSSPAEKEKFLSTCHENKKSQPEVYKEHVRLGLDQIDSLRRANAITNMPPDQIEKAVSFYETLLLKNGVDVIGDKAVVSTSNTNSSEARGHASSSSSDLSFSKTGFRPTW
jgi:tyrosinase